MKTTHDIGGFKVQLVVIDEIPPDRVLIGNFDYSEERGLVFREEGQIAGLDPWTHPILPST